MDIFGKKLLTKFCMIALSAVVLTGGAVVASQENFVQTGISVNAAWAGRFEYEVTEDGTVTITQYTGNEAEVIIPSKIDGKTVTNIANDVFWGARQLTSITIPDSVTRIGWRAFSNCTSLTDITIPDSVTSIAGGAFNNTAWYQNQQDGLVYIGKVLYQYKGTMPENTEIIIPDSVKGIGDRAFADYNNLTSITIPDSVINMGEETFDDCTGLTSITIPKSVTNIGNWVFYGCKNLTSITISEGVTSIGDCAFRDCGSLSTITIPNSVTSIGTSAFYSCNSLNSINISDNVMNIGDWAFSDCNSLTKIDVAQNNSKYVSVDGVLFNQGQTEIICYPKGKQGPYTIPDSVESIGYYQFSDCTGLTSITIPNSVTSIGDSAFSGCTGLTSIVIPDSVTSIGNYSLYGCSSLSSVTIPDSVTSIGNYSFYGCSSLSSVTIPDSVTSIGNYSFGACDSLSSVTISDRVINIGNYAFSDCCSLTKIDVAQNNSKYVSVDGVLFNKEQTELICYPAGKQGSYTIPDSITSIGRYAFDNSSLTSITIPDSVTNIEKAAFYRCTGLTRIIIPHSVTSINEGVFSGCTSLTSIAIPDSVTSIGYGAFSGCNNLTSITIPESVTSIIYAFYNCDNLTIYGIKDSYAESYANQNNIKFVSLLENTCSVSAESIVLGNKITLKGAATGGKAPYTYAYYYKKTTDKKWVTAKGFSDTTSVSIKPAMAKDYDICIKVKDADGKVERKYFTVKVNEKLAIKASVSAENLKLGNQLTLLGAATGGSGDYTYAYYYKKTTDKKWVTAKNFSDTTSVTIKPAMAKDYEICIKVKDSTGATQKQYFIVKVTA